MSEPVLYVLKRYPRLSETFVVQELMTLESLGEDVLIDCLLPAEDGPRHPDVDRVRAAVRYLPRHPRLRNLPVACAHARIFLRSPLRWVHEARRAQHFGLWRRFIQAGLTADRAKRAGVAHVHAHFATAATDVAGIAGRLTGLPVTVTAHAKDIFHEDNAPLLRRRLSRASGVVTVSAHNAAHLEAVVPTLPVHHVPNGVAVPSAAPGPTKDGTILCVARLVEKKGVDTLLHALAELNRDRFGVPAEIVGDGPLRGELERLAERLGLGPRVRFLGALPSTGVEAAYGRAAMVVLACRVGADGDRDGLPTVLLEAMGRGLPVISTSVAGIPELVLHEENGLLVPPDRPDALAAAIDRLHANPDFAAALGTSGRATVAATHDPVRSARALQRIFHP